MFPANSQRGSSSNGSAAVELRVPTIDAQEQFAEMLDEIRRFDECHHHGIFEIAMTSFEQYLRMLVSLRDRLHRDRDLYPIDNYFVYDYSRLVGEVRIRHRLDADVEKIGGSITLYIRPSMRRNGIGTEAFSQALGKATERGVRRMLVTALSVNLAAIRLIETNNGIRISDINAPVGTFQRYRFFPYLEALDSPDAPSQD